MYFFTSKTSLHVSHSTTTTPPPPHTTLQNELQENQLIKLTTCEEWDDGLFVKSLTGQLVLTCDVRRQRGCKCGYICRITWGVWEESCGEQLLHSTGTTALKRKDWETPPVVTGQKRFRSKKSQLQKHYNFRILNWWRQKCHCFKYTDKGQQQEASSELYGINNRRSKQNDIRMKTLNNMNWYGV